MIQTFWDRSCNIFAMSCHWPPHVQCQLKISLTLKLNILSVTFCSNKTDSKWYSWNTEIHIYWWKWNKHRLWMWRKGDNWKKKWNLKKMKWKIKYHSVGTIPKSNIKIVERLCSFSFPVYSECEYCTISLKSIILYYWLVCI